MTIGWRPAHENIALNNGDFIYSRTNDKGPLPPGTTAEIKWDNAVTWPGTVDGGTVSWRIESENCTEAIIPTGANFEMFIRYPNAATSSTDDYVWKRGQAVRPV